LKCRLIDIERKERAGMSTSEITENIDHPSRVVMMDLGLLRADGVKRGALLQPE